MDGGMEAWMVMECGGDGCGVSWRGWNGMDWIILGG